MKKSLILQSTILIIIIAVILILSNIIKDRIQIEEHYVLDMVFSKEIDKNKLEDKVKEIIVEKDKEQKYRIITIGDNKSAYRIILKKDINDDKYEHLKEIINKEIDYSSKFKDKKYIPKEISWINIDTYILNAIIIIIAMVLSTLVITKTFSENRK